MLSNLPRVPAGLTQQDRVSGEDPGVTIPRTVLSMLAWHRNLLGTHCLSIFSLEKAVVFFDLETCFLHPLPLGPGPCPAAEPPLVSWH